MLLRIYISIALFAIVNSCQSQSFPDTLLFKKYEIQSAAMIKLFSDVSHLDSSILLTKLSDWETQANNKGDKNLSYSIRTLKYKILIKNDKLVPEVESGLNILINDVNQNKTERIWAEALQLLANYYWRKKNYPGALENYIYANNIYSHYTAYEYPEKAESLMELGQVYYHFRDYKTAKKYFLEICNELPPNMVDNLVSKTNTLALCYSKLEDYDSSAYYFHRAEQIAINTNQAVWIGIISGNLATNFANQKNFEEAKRLYEKDIKYSLVNDRADAAVSLAALSEIYADENNKERALLLADSAYQIVLERKLWNKPMFVKGIYPAIAKAFALNGMMGPAYHYLDSGMKAGDSMTKERNALMLTGVQQKIDVEKHIAELREKEKELVTQKRLRNTFLTGFAIVLLLSTIVLWQKRKIVKEKKRSEELLLNILPSETADELKETGAAKAKKYDIVTVLFTDFKNFTETSQTMSAEELVQEINYCYSTFDKIIAKYGIEKIKTIGDSYMCAGGLPIVTKTHAEDIVSAALEMIQFIEKEKEERQVAHKIFFEMRIGIHSGPVVAGIVGIKKFAYDIWGDTVNIASRMESSGEAGKINISTSTYDLVKDKFQCTFRGEIDAKNKGIMKMYFVEGIKPLKTPAEEPLILEEYK